MRVVFAARSPYCLPFNTYRIQQRQQQQQQQHLQHADAYHHADANTDSSIVHAGHQGYHSDGDEDRDEGEDRDEEGHLHHHDAHHGQHSIVNEHNDVHHEDDDEDDDMDDDPDESSELELPEAEEDIDYDVVYALHTFLATVEGQASVVKGDQLTLLDDSNSYWWLVRVLKTQLVGYIPAENIETPEERLARFYKKQNLNVSSRCAPA